MCDMGRALVLLTCCTCAFALNPDLDISQYAHTSWKISDGFPKGVVNSIAQTPDGYLWLGTQFGLVRFDGVRHLEWAPPGGEQLPSNEIRGLLVSRDGTLWIGTRKGLASWKGDRLTRYGELADQSIGPLLEDREGTVWAGELGTSTGRLCAIRTGRVQCYGEDGRFGVGILSLYEHMGDLWAGAFTGLWRWKPGPPRLYPVPGRPNPNITGLIEGDNGALWIATPEGMQQFVNGKVEPYPFPAGGQFHTHRLFRDREGSLWIGTRDQGLWHVHQGKVDGFTSADGLSGGSVGRAFEDREGNIWVSTTEGLDRFRDFTVSTISFKQGLASATVTSVLASKDDSVWVGTTDGLTRWKNGQFTIYRKSATRRLDRPAQRSGAREITDGALPDNYVMSLLQDDRGRIWVSTQHGVAYFENGRFIPVAPVPGANAASLVEDSPGSIWINDRYLGLVHLLDERVAGQIPWTAFGPKSSPPARLAADHSKGGLWVGFAKGGIAFLRDGQVGARYTAGQGLGEGSVNDLRVDSDGTLWTATEGGLSRLKDGRIATLTKGNGLPCDTVYWSIEDDARSLWLYMPCGLVRVARYELDAWIANPSYTVKSAVFDSSDGVRTLATPTGYSPRVTKSADGKLLFDSLSGVSIVDSRRLLFNKLPPPVHVEQITADRKTYGAGAKLPPLTRDLEIDYTALSLVNPEKNRFRYKLEGHDRDWQDSGTRRQAFYNDLPPRNYRFRVMASNNSGVWNEAGAFLDFSVDPAYHQTTWVRLSVVAAFLAMLWGLYSLRVRQLAWKFNVRMEERVNERTRIARDFHDTLLQSFQGVLMMLSVVAHRIKDPPEAKEQLETIVEQARKAVTEGRDAVQGLRTSTVVTNDLARAISTLGEELTAGLAADQAGTCPEFRVRVDGTTRDLAPLVRDDVHRIACEALQNAFRHAQAGRIEVEIRYDRQQLRLRVLDNGKGIDQKVLSAGGRTGHFGLAGMQERAKLVGGKLTVSSRVDSGTEVELTIPAALAYTKSPVTAKPMSLGKGT